jgi:hypothetical protein
MPAGYTHEPMRERLRVPGYYDDPAYDDYPAIAVNWWSACAFARFDGKGCPHPWNGRPPPAAPAVPVG